MRTFTKIERVLVGNKDMLRKISIRIVKRVAIRISVPNNRIPLQVFRAKKGHYYTHEDIDSLLFKAATKIEEMFPTIEFRLVCLPDFQFNFIAKGIKEEDNVRVQPETDQRAEDSSAPEAKQE